MKCRKKYYGSS